MVDLSKTERWIFHFRFRLIFINMFLFNKTHELFDFKTP